MGYIVAMPTPKVISVVAATYVRDLDGSRTFYAALGFTEGSSGSNDLSAWSSLHHEGHSILLVTSAPAVDIPPLPLLFYFFVDDLTAAIRSLQDAGSTVTHVGHPPHAPGGEAKTLDPDGNTILLGQATRLTTEPAPQTEPAQRFSLLKEAAALARHRVEANLNCQVGNAGGGPCVRPAQVKLADSWGNTAWACLPHAEEVLVNARGTFIASQDDQGLETFLAGRRG